MEIYRQKVVLIFVIMLGDNIYGEHRSKDFAEKFEQPYKPLRDTGVKFHASLGNHDPHGERLYEPFNMGGERYYTFQKGDASFFVLDSNAIFLIRCIRMGSITGAIWFCGGRKCCRFSNEMRVNAVFSGHDRI